MFVFLLVLWLHRWHLATGKQLFDQLIAQMHDHGQAGEQQPAKLVTKSGVVGVGGSGR